MLNPSALAVIIDKSRACVTEGPGTVEQAEGRYVTSGSEDDRLHGHSFQLIQV